MNTPAPLSETYESAAVTALVPDRAALKVNTDVLTTEQVEKLHGLFKGEIAGDFDDLLFLDDNIVQWDKVVTECKDTYFPANDGALGKRMAGVIANIITPPEDLTLVTCGANTRFDKEEGVIDALEALGHKFASVVYIDKAGEALNRAMDAGQKRLKHAVHQRVQGDMYDPNLKYDVIGDREIRTGFGLPFGNISGFPNVNFSHAVKVLTERLGGIKSQMDKNGHAKQKNAAALIATYGIATNRQDIKKAYSGEAHDELAMNSFRILFGEDNLDDHFIINREYHNPDNNYSSRGYRAVGTFDIELEGEVYRINKDHVLWTGNSVYLPEEQVKACHDLVGLDYKHPAEIRTDQMMCPQVFAKPRHNM